MTLTCLGILSVIEIRAYYNKDKLLRFSHESACQAALTKQIKISKGAVDFHSLAFAKTDVGGGKKNWSNDLDMFILTEN